MVENPNIDDIEEAVDANSVRKVIILADVFGIPESYNNVRVLWNKIGLNALKMICACDHKMANIICGIQVIRCYDILNVLNVNSELFH